jgi:hypothetical protein
MAFSVSDVGARFYFQENGEGAERTEYLNTVKLCFMWQIVHSCLPFVYEVLILKLTRTETFAVMVNI